MRMNKDDAYWKMVDKVNYLVSNGYINEEDFESTLNRMLENSKHINSNRQGDVGASPYPKHNN